MRWCLSIEIYTSDFVGGFIFILLYYIFCCLVCVQILGEHKPCDNSPNEAYVWTKEMVNKKTFLGRYICWSLVLPHVELVWVMLFVSTSHKT